MNGAPDPRVVGPFRLLEERGRDEVGTLWSAVDGRTGAAVELRILPAGLARSNLLHSRFLRDAARAASLDLPAAVRVLEGGESGGELWLASAPPEGRTLASILEAARASPPPEGAAPLPGEGGDPFARAASFFERLALGLAGIHAAGLVHGRLEPGRILLGEDGAARVRDLGLPGAGMLGELSLDRAPVRATPWSAPEALDPTELLEPRADVYSLGALLYQCLALRPPYDEATAEGLAWRIRSADPVPIRRWNPRVPQGLARIVSNAMARDRGPRYRSAVEFAADLRRFLEGKRIPVRKERLPARLVRWPVRHPVVVFSGLMAALVAEAGLLIWAGRLPVEDLERQVETLRVRAEQDRRRLEAAAETEGWARAARALEPFLAASRDHGSADPDLAILLAREAILRARSGEWRDHPDALAFRRRAADRLREALRDDREVGRSRPTGRPAGAVVPAGSGSGGAAIGGGDGTVRILDGEGRPTTLGTGHDGPVRAVRAGPWETLYASASEDGTARIWSEDGKTALVVASHGAPVNAAALDPGGNRLLTASDDGTARFTDLAGNLRAECRGHGGPVLDAAFARAGGRLLTASADGTARIWDRDGRGAAVLSGHGGPVTRILPGLLPEGRLLTLSADGTARTWTAAGDPLLVLPHGAEPTGAAALPGGRIATGCRDGRVRIFDGDGRAVLDLDLGAGPVAAVDFAPVSGLLLAACGDGTVRLLRQEGLEVDRFSAAAGAAVGAAFGRDGEVVHASFADGSVRTWRREATELGLRRGPPGEVKVALAPAVRGANAGCWAALPAAGGGFPSQLVLLRAGTAATEITRPLGENGVTALAVGGVGAGTVAAGKEDGEVRTFTGRAWALEAAGGGGGSAVGALALAADGTSAVGYEDGRVRFNEGSTARRGKAPGSEVALPGCARPVLSLDIAEGTCFVLAGAADGTIHHWNPLGPKGPAHTALPGPGSPVAAVAWSRTWNQGDRRFLAVGADGTYALHDSRGRRLWKAWRRLPEGGVRTAKALRGGSFLVLTDSGDGRCRVWRIDGEGGPFERVATLEGTGVVASAALEEQGTVAAVASLDGTVRLFALDEDGLLEVARRRVPRDFTEQERTRLAPLPLRAPPLPRGGKR
ncbi:MAG: protein kinase [Planctomycetes bacterium]|nr:protein kinase [Planctomycetota bacterium]